MDFGNIGENLPLVATIIGLILLQFFLRRRRKPETTHGEIVQSLLSEVKLNQAIAETFVLRKKPRKFETVSWQRNNTKLDFLERPVQIALSDAFTITEDFNEQIAAAKKYKSATYMVNVNAGKLKEPLAKSKHGLEEWLMSSTGVKELPPKSTGIFDDWLGKG